jgi:hypothetical protein
MNSSFPFPHHRCLIDSPLFLACYKLAANPFEPKSKFVFFSMHEAKYKISAYNIMGYGIWHYSCCLLMFSSDCRMCWALSCLCFIRFTGEGEAYDRLCKTLPCRRLLQGLPIELHPITAIYQFWGRDEDVEDILWCIEYSLFITTNSKINYVRFNNCLNVSFKWNATNLHHPITPIPIPPEIPTIIPQCHIQQLKPFSTKIQSSHLISSYSGREGMGGFLIWLVLVSITSSIIP